MNTLEAISPIDGRYRSKTEQLANYFSERALMQYRVRVEIEYFIALCSLNLEALKDFDKSNFARLREIYQTFNDEDASEIKDIEKTTNHDVKAVEYFIKRRFDTLHLEKYKEFIHFGLTSQDINNTAMPLMMKECHEDVFLPLLTNVVDLLEEKVIQWHDIPMLAHTHGQPASPTMLSKEIKVFAYRLKQQMSYFAFIPFTCKFGGATGNFNAHSVAFPQIDWISFGNSFCEDLGLKRQRYTTQIENYDNMAAYFNCIMRINTILIDFCRDIWSYNSMEYFKQKIKEGEVGSSAMPHKVNPIDFENAEGNLGMANAIFEHLAAKLPISRLQRDLTDSTVLRNVGVPYGHLLIAIASLQKGLGKIYVNEPAIHADLEENWAVVAEAIQTILRREGYPKPYETLKELTRTNETINEASIENFINTLNVSDAVKDELRHITPFN